MDQNNWGNSPEPAKKEGLDRFAHLTPSVGGGFSGPKPDNSTNMPTIDDLLKKTGDNSKLEDAKAPEPSVANSADKNSSPLFNSNTDKFDEHKIKAEEKKPAMAELKPDKSGKVNLDGKDDDFLSFEEKKPSGAGGFFIWAAAIIAVAGAVFFYLLGNSAASKLTEENGEIDSINAQVASSSYKDVAVRAADFKAAVAKMSSADSTRFPMSDFLPKIYTAIDKNVTISSLSISADGKISFSGTTNSYKSIAEQLATLKAWQQSGKPGFTTVSLDSYSESVSDKGVVTAPFSISGQLDRSLFVTSTAATTGTTAAATTGATMGGTQ